MTTFKHRKTPDPHVCHDCGAKEGEIHDYGCDMETCPFCGGQLLSCECRYELLNIDVSPGTWAYNHGLTEEQREKFIALLEKQGRIPYLQIPYFCELCGKRYPDMFNVPDEEWDKFVIPPLQHKVLCIGCYNRQKRLFPNGWRKAK